MVKKFLAMTLVLVLAAGFAAAAAEANFQYDVLSEEFSIRGEQGPLLAEIPFAEKEWKGLNKKEWGLSGFNLGLKGPELSPFYAKLQFNWLRSKNTDKYNFNGIEIGVGGVYDLWDYTSFGGELSLLNPSLKEINSEDWSLEVYVKYNLDDFLGLTATET